MAGLAAVEGAMLITLDVLGDYEAHEMLARRLGQERIAAEPAATDERAAATSRMLDHYLHTAMAASQRFSPFRSPPRLPAPQPGVLPAEMADKDQARAWFDAEIRALLSMIRYAETGGFDTYAWQLPWALGPFFHRRGWLRAYLAIQQTALAAAERLGDTLTLAHAHHLLGHAQLQLNEYDLAEPDFRRALDLFRELADVVHGKLRDLDEDPDEDQDLDRGAGHGDDEPWPGAATTARSV